MTGPEHYAEAERLIALIDSQQNTIPEQRLAHAALAQVHATLALAAATAFTSSGVPQDGDTGMEWRRAIIRPRPTITNHPAHDDRRAAEMHS